jgi:drug/metabolite transporter, DME family
MDERHEGQGLGAVVFLAAAVLWGTVGPAQVLAASPMGPAALGGWRLLGGGIVLGAFTVTRRERLRTLASRSVVRPLLVCALCTGLYQVAFMSAVDRTGAALATVIALGSVPAATGVCARWVNGERVGLAWLISTVAAVAGCALLLAPGGSGGTRVDALGLLLAVITGACYALYTVSAKRVVDADPAVDLPTLSALCLLAGSLMFVPWMVRDAATLRHGGGTVALIAWLCLAATALPYWLYSVGLPRLRGASTAGTLSLAEPLSAALLGVLLLHERISATAWVGCGLILGGMLVTLCLPAPRTRIAPSRA